MSTPATTIAPTSGWSVKCSVCWQQGPEDDSISRAVELARAAGWVAVEIRGQQVTLCPACVSVLTRQKGEVKREPSRV